MNECEYRVVSNRIRVNVAISQMGEVLSGDDWGVTQKERVEIVEKLRAIENRLFKLIDGFIEGEQMNIITVGDLREALKDAPDGRRLHFQVIATNGEVGYMSCTASPTAYGDNPSMAVISLRHPDLKQLVFENPEG